MDALYGGDNAYIFNVDGGLYFLAKAVQSTQKATFKLI